MPGRATVSRRLRVTGMNFCTTGRSSARNGARFLVAGFAVSTSGSRSSRAARRLTKVVFACRITGGRRAQRLVEGDVLAGDGAEGGVGVGDRAGELFAAAGDGGRQLAGADDELFEQPLVGVEFAGEGADPVERGAEVLVGVVGVFALAGIDFRVALDEVAEPLADRGREGVEELVDVDRRRRRGEAQFGPVFERRVAVRAGADRDVVVGDAGERGGADHRGRPLVQFLADFDVDFGEVFVAEVDAFDRADRRAADQHLVVGHQLAGILEDERVLVAAAAAEEDDPEGDDHHREGRDRRDSGWGDPPARSRAFLLA